MWGCRLLMRKKGVMCVGVFDVIFISSMTRDIPNSNEINDVSILCDSGEMQEGLFALHLSACLGTR